MTMHMHMCVTGDPPDGASRRGLWAVCVIVRFAIETTTHTHTQTHNSAAEPLSLCVNKDLCCFEACIRTKPTIALWQACKA